MKKGTLYYLSAAFPYGEKEQFLTQELNSIHTFFDQIMILPLNISGLMRNEKMPLNVEVLNIEGGFSSYKRSTFWRNFPLVLKVLFSDLNSQNGLKFFFGIRDRLVEILKAIELGERFIQVTAIQDRNKNFYYSNWMNEWALTLSILYHKKKISNFSFKMRGYDLFDERRQNNFIPFRKFIFENSSCQIAVSETGVKYLKAKGFKSVVLNYSGVTKGELFHGSNTDKFTLVSCSYMSSIKRVPLIAESLSFVEFPVKWVHFGDGEEMDKVRRIVRNLPSNIEVELAGNHSNEDILNYYGKNKVDAFIHLSSSEGFGMAIIEAFSFGIPAILFPGGAVKELINPEYCIEVPLNSNPKLIAQCILNAKISFYNNNEVRKLAQEDCARKFSLLNQGIELWQLITNNKNLIT